MQKIYKIILSLAVILFTLITVSFNANANQGRCDNYDPVTNSCLPEPTDEPEPTPTCETNKNYCASEQQKCSYHPSDASCKGVTYCDNYDRVTNTCTPEPKPEPTPVSPQECPQGLGRDPVTNACIAETKPEPTPVSPQECPQGLGRDPVTNKCYNPFPIEPCANGAMRDPKTNECPDTIAPPPNTCPYGKFLNPSDGDCIDLTRCPDGSLADPTTNECPVMPPASSCKTDENLCTRENICTYHPKSSDCYAVILECQRDPSACVTLEQRCQYHPNSSGCSNPTPTECLPGQIINPTDGDCIDNPTPPPPTTTTGVSEPIGILVTITALSLLLLLRRRK